MEDRTTGKAGEKRTPRRSATTGEGAPIADGTAIEQRDAASAASISSQLYGESGNSAGDEQSRGFMGRVRERASEQLNTQKNRATEEIGSAVHAVRQSTQHLRAQQHDTVAQYIESAADQLDRFANRIKEKNINELFDDAQRFARRQPALFIGGAFALGLLGSRFFKSSPPERQMARAYDRDYYRHGELDRPSYGTAGTTGTSGAFGNSGVSRPGGTSGASGTIGGTSRDIPGTETY